MDKLAGISCNCPNELLVAYDHKEDYRVLMDPKEIGWWLVYGEFMS